MTETFPNMGNFTYSKKATGYYFIGYHEIMIPLLFAALKSRQK